MFVSAVFPHMRLERHMREGLDETCEEVSTGRYAKKVDGS